MSLHDLFADVLDLATKWSANGSPEMTARDELLAQCAAEIEVIVQDFGEVGAGLKVKAGGRQGAYSPLPWVRIYDAAFSPSAQAGFYAVYLFAADGSAVYASLNQGTSEWRGNKMRPVNDETELTGAAVVARHQLESIGWALPAGAEVRLDLRRDSVAVNPESRQRMRNYEVANIYGLRYARHDLPTDQAISEDLNRQLTDLRILYGDANQTSHPGALPDESQDQPTLVVGKQGKIADPLRRKAIELQAEDVAVAHYEADGWKVQRVGQLKLGYDLKCVRDGEELHVEVKGATGQVSAVTLTPNELDHARNYPSVALAVVSGIGIGTEYQVTSPGQLHLLDPWTVDETKVVPTEYLYAVAGD
jgi:hypothetical protein